MKKLFSFAAALLFGLSAMADITVTVPTSTYTLPDLEDAWTWAGKVDNHYVVKGDTIIFNANELYQSKSAKQPWYTPVTGGTSSADWAAQGCFVGAAGWQLNGAKVNTYATVKETNDRLHFFRVTNCSGALALVKSGSNKKRTIYLEAYELTDGAAAATPAASATWEENTEHVIAIEDLDATKQYVIAVYATGTGTGGSSSGNSNFYEIAFVTGGQTVTKHTVFYYDGETLRGTEKVVEGETPAKYADYQTKPRHTFDGWYNEAGLTTTADLTAAINADKAFYGKWTAEPMTYSTSLNIEQGVLDNSKNWDIAAALAAANIAYAHIDLLDSLDASKTAGNEPFLGLKLKTAGAYVEVGLHANDVLRVKFGNVAADLKVNGTSVAKANLATPYEYTATTDEYVRFETTTDGTVVLKQIMINTPIADVVLPGQEADKNVKLAAITLNGDTIEGFGAEKKTYTIELPAGTTTAPTVAATTADSNAAAVVNQATAVPGDATVVVTAADGTTTATYTIHFVLPRAIEYLQAPYDVTNADFSTLPNWLHGNVVYNANYQGGDTTYCGHQVLRTITYTDPVHFYVGACDSLILKVSATGSRTAQLAIGDSIYATKEVKKGAVYEVVAYIHSNAAENHVVFSTPGANGGTTIFGIKLTAYNDTTTAVENIVDEKAVKVFENGQLIIIKNGVRYSATGMRL